MILFMQNMTKPYILVFDIEHESQKIIQISGIIVEHLGNNLYQICRSINIYIKDNIIPSMFVQQYTNITSDFLTQYGVKLEKAQRQWKDFLQPFKKDDLLVVSHGIFQDSIIMRNNGFAIDDYEQWCTYNMAKWVCNRNENLSLIDLSQEMGYNMLQPHNAYADAFANLLVFSYLLKLENMEDD